MNDIKKTLEKYHNFQECIIREIHWLDYGLTYELKFNYIWDASGNVRKNLDTDVPITLRFNLVQEFHFNHFGFNSPQLAAKN
jgi:hypothetical protein